MEYLKDRCFTHVMTKSIKILFVSRILSGLYCLHFVYNVKITTELAALEHLKSKRKAMNRNWCNQKANPALNTKAGN